MRKGVDFAHDFDEQIDVLQSPSSRQDGVNDFIEPTRSFTAWRALTARFVMIKVHEIRQALDHALSIVENNHGTRSKHRSQLREIFIIHRR